MNLRNLLTPVTRASKLTKLIVLGVGVGSLALVAAACGVGSDDASSSDALNHDGRLPYTTLILKK
jgi:hypothetical protein